MICVGVPAHTYIYENCLLLHSWNEYREDREIVSLREKRKEKKNVGIE